MGIFTNHQRDILVRRVARALLWSEIDRSNLEHYHISACERSARAVVEELEVSGFSAASQRRAIENIVARLEKPEPEAVAS